MCACAAVRWRQMQPSLWSPFHPSPSGQPGGQETHTHKKTKASVGINTSTYCGAFNADTDAHDTKWSGELAYITRKYKMYRSLTADLFHPSQIQTANACTCIYSHIYAYLFVAVGHKGPQLKTEDTQDYYMWPQVWNSWSVSMLLKGMSVSQTQSHKARDLRSTSSTQMEMTEMTPMAILEEHWQLLLKIFARAKPVRLAGASTIPA